MNHSGEKFVLENGELRVTVSRHGAELSSIWDKKAEREFLWEADPAVWKRHAPVLFPFVGKSFQDKVTYQGKTYDMKSHGFARDMDFEPVLCDMDECWYRLKDTPETRAHYPFPFELEIGHRLSGRSVEVMWKVVNPQAEEMLFMIGGHPAFRVPEGRSIYDFTLAFNQKGAGRGTCQDQLHYQAPDSQGYEDPTLGGTLRLDHGAVPITKGFFKTALTYIFDQSQVSSASLLLDGKPYATVICDGFPYMGLWSVEETHPFVCLEPWFGRCETKGGQGELKDRDGVVRLGPWETWEKSYTIEFGSM